MTHQISQLRRPRQGSGNSRPSSSDRTLCSRHYLPLVLESCRANPVQTHANGIVQALCKFARAYYLLCAHQPKHQQHYMLHLASSNMTNEMLQSETETFDFEFQTRLRPSKIFTRPRPLISGRRPRLRPRDQTLAEDITFHAALVCRAR